MDEQTIIGARCRRIISRCWYRACTRPKERRTSSFGQIAHSAMLRNCSSRVAFLICSCKRCLQISSVAVVHMRHQHRSAGRHREHSYQIPQPSLIRPAIIAVYSACVLYYIGNKARCRCALQRRCRLRHRECVPVHGWLKPTAYGFNKSHPSGDDQVR